MTDTHYRGRTSMKMNELEEAFNISLRKLWNFSSISDHFTWTDRNESKQEFSVNNTTLHAVHNLGSKV